VSKPARTPDAPDPAPEGAGFEEALSRLEAIVEAMESDDLPLEDLVKQFEEGARLAALCQARLRQAEQKIQQLEKKAGVGFALAPLAGDTDSNEL
jgi:exodeoxyribonuclease VII small subunit